MKPLRLLFLSTRMSVGGPAKVTVGLAEKLAARGYPVAIAEGDPEPGEIPDPRVAASRLPRHHVAGLTRPIRPGRDLLAFLRVRALLAAERPDVLLTAGAKAGALGRLAARTLSRRIQTVHVFHGHVFTGHFSSRAGRLFARLERLLARLSDDLVAICGSVERDLRALGLHRRARLHRIYIGYGFFAPFLEVGPPRGDLQRELGLDPATFLAIYPARICWVKAQDLMIEALGRAREKLSDRRFQLVFVGDGEGRDRLERRAQELGVADSIRFLGYRHDMAAIYRDASLVVLASRSEGTPVSLIEGIVAGRPFLATAVGGVPEIYRDGMGRLVAPEDPAAFAAALVSLVEQGARPPLPDAIRREVAERFSLERFADDMERVFRGSGA